MGYMIMIKICYERCSVVSW